uniref:Uncharacterized protein n=1 Tax=Cyprinus carpio carpio TaxID=630221 RepID=A0A9J8BWX9_CYPCA
MAMLRSLLLLFIVFSMGNADAEIAEKCPNGWTIFGVRCFKYFSQSVNWITAEEAILDESSLICGDHRGKNFFKMGDKLWPKFCCQHQED